jgi:hypothetical protein
MVQRAKNRIDLPHIATSNALHGAIKFEEAPSIIPLLIAAGEFQDKLDIP